MFRKSLIIAAALLAGTSLGAMAGSVMPVTNIRDRRRRLWVPADRRQHPLSGRLAAGFLPLQA